VHSKVAQIVALYIVAENSCQPLELRCTQKNSCGKIVADHLNLIPTVCDDQPVERSPVKVATRYEIVAVQIVAVQIVTTSGQKSCSAIVAIEIVTKNPSKVAC
jgi:hypothetical protein